MNRSLSSSLGPSSTASFTAPVAREIADQKAIRVYIGGEEGSAEVIRAGLCETLIGLTSICLGKSLIVT